MGTGNKVNASVAVSRDFYKYFQSVKCFGNAKSLW